MSNFTKLLSRLINGKTTSCVEDLASGVSKSRFYGRGFRTDDFSSLLYEQRLDNIRKTELKKIRIHPNIKHKAGIRKTMFSDLPWVYTGACELKPDDNDLASQIDGAKHRVGGQTLPICKKTLLKFRLFVKNWIVTNLKPLDRTTDCSVETWLAESPYTMDRKAELMGIYQKYTDGYLRGRDVDFERLESFIKDEFYTCPKTFRTINSRVEIFKCLVGPTIHQVEKEVFKHPSFIKKIPVDQRGEYIDNMLNIPGNGTYGSDVSSWEGSVKKSIMKVVEVPLFEYMTQNLTHAKEFMKLYIQLLLNNKLCFSGFFCEILSRRMSGEMSTSVANGFINLMLILFTAFMLAVIVMVVAEGDDALVSSPVPLTDKYFKKLGFNMVLVKFDGVNEASFCGLVFSDYKHTIRDPIRTVLKLGWCTQQYTLANVKTRMQLLRAKALSLKCEMPNSPILGPLADRLIKLTEGICIKKSIQRLVKHMSLYKRNEFLDMVNDYKTKWLVPAAVSADSRVLMEKMYKVDVNTQLVFEDQVETMTLGHFNCPAFDTYIHNDNKRFWNTYIKDVPSCDYEDVKLASERMDRYATYLPLNDPSDPRNIIQPYTVTARA